MTHTETRATFEDTTRRIQSTGTIVMMIKIVNLANCAELTEKVDT